MELATTTGDFSRYLADQSERVRHVCAAGFRHIDLSMYSLRDDAELLLSDDWRSCAAAIKAAADEFSADFVQAHSPGGDPIKGDERFIGATRRSIEVCSLLGIPNLVVHAGVVGPDKESFLEANRRFFMSILPLAQSLGVNILAENSTTKNMGRNYYPYTGRDMIELVRFVGHPSLHVCWDTGHGNCEGVQYDEIKALGSELYGLHINDNRGGGDEHVIPYFGTLNCDDVMNALIDIGYDGYFTFECGSVLRPSKYWLGDRRPFDRDTRLAEPTLEMQDALENVLYVVGKHVLCAYGAQ